MIPLPEKGDAASAAEAMNARLKAVMPEVQHERPINVGAIEIDAATGEQGGTGLAPLRRMYGDLFDVGEVVQVGYSTIEMFMFDVARGRRDPMGALTSLFLMGVGMGAMMERARWLREAGDE